MNPPASCGNEQGGAFHEPKLAFTKHPQSCFIARTMKADEVRLCEKAFKG
jgi:hypothetical protein